MSLDGIQKHVPISCAGRIYFLVGLSFFPNLGTACAVCFGASESPLTQGINMAIFSLFGITVFVLLGFAVFFLHLRKRAKLFSRPRENGQEFH